MADTFIGYMDLCFWHLQKKITMLSLFVFTCDSPDLFGHNGFKKTQSEDSEFSASFVICLGINESVMGHCPKIVLKFSFVFYLKDSCFF